MEISRATFGPEKDGYAVEHDGETYRFQEDGDTAVYVGEGKITQAVVDALTKDRVSAVSYSGTVSEEIVGYVGEVSGGGGVEVRSDDPADPSGGDWWYRQDRETFRFAVEEGGNVGIIETRAVYDVPSETIIEDFEGKTVSDITTLTTSGSPEFDIIQQDGSDWASVSFDSDSDAGAIGIDTGVPDKKGIAARIDIEGGSETFGDGFRGDLIASEGFAVSDGDLFCRIRDGSPSEVALIQTKGPSATYGSQVEFDIPFPEIHENYFKVRYGHFDDAQRVFLEVETVDDRYFDTAEASTGVNDFRTLSVGNSASFEPPGSIATDYLGEATYEGQLSPALAHSDLADAPPSAHHTRPSAGTGLSEGASNNFRAGETPTDLSGTTGDFDGQVRIDDGTNTSIRGIMCVWDGTNSVWVPQDGGSTFT